MRKVNYITRLNIIMIIVAVLAVVCIVRLFDLQIVKGATYETQANDRLVRAYSIPAPRGEILDCKDKPIVKNRVGYSVQFQKMDVTNDELNKMLYNAACLVAKSGGEIESTFPIIKDGKTGELTYDFSIEKNGGTRRVEGFKYPKTEDSEEDEETEVNAEAEAEKLEKWRKSNKLTEHTTPEQIINYYRKKYEVSSQFDDDKALTIIAIRYQMEKSGFSEKEPYTLARDVDELVVQQIKEQFMDYSSANIVIEPVRIYAKGRMAAHIIGRTGRIYAEEYAEMKNKGYGMNDTIGKDGIEKILEEYLKGKDGYKSVDMSRAGGTAQILGYKEPIPGNFARLTIDSDLQRVMEASLKENILSAYGSGGTGAAIAVDPKTGGVLAIASYPNYDLTTYNESYDSLLKSKAKPLINRALSGTYSPGSTFKPLTSIAALETGIISPETYIEDKGRYTFFDSYQPTCLVYSSTGGTHGTINVSEAIGVSCNYFFYEVGRKTGIEKIAEYAKDFGLGQPTGIELPESTGILATPQNREKMGGIWYPGDVLQAAIGQSDNMFTPAQLASYVCTILNKGTRYSLHLIDEVVDYDTKKVVYKKETEVLSERKISDSTYNAVKNGMRRVVTSGTASAAFTSAKYKAAGKTGTAEVPDGADNVLFVGFAPYDEPEIVIAVIIEHGANSIFPANVARAVFDAYMQIKDGSYTSSETEVPEKEEEKQPITPYISVENGTNGKTKEDEDKGAVRPEASAPEASDTAKGEGTL